MSNWNQAYIQSGALCLLNCLMKLVTRGAGDSLCLWPIITDVLQPQYGKTRAIGAMPVTEIVTTRVLVYCIKQFGYTFTASCVSISRAHQSPAHHFDGMTEANVLRTASSH